MYFCAIIGDPGAGKTNLMTALLYEAHCNGYDVVANYRLYFDYALLPFSQLAKLGPEIQDAIVGMDELGEGADSYDFFDSNVKKIGKLVRQVRKRNCLVYFTVQRYSLIAARLRRQVDMFILMEDIDKHKAGHTKWNCDNRFRIEVMNGDYKTIKRRIFNGKGLYNGVPVQSLYNTNEIIWGYEDEDGHDTDEEDAAKAATHNSQRARRSGGKSVVGTGRFIPPRNSDEAALERFFQDKMEALERGDDFEE